MIPRTIFSAEHDLFRDTARRFIAERVVPEYSKWEAEGIVSRDVWLAAGEIGLLCPTVPEADDGPGGDFLHSAVITEEMARVGAVAPTFYLQSDIIAPYLVHFGTEEQKRRWLPGMVSGEVGLAACAHFADGVASSQMAELLRGRHKLCEVGAGPSLAAGRGIPRSFRSDTRT